jgi:hypothetical protein
VAVHREFGATPRAYLQLLFTVIVITARNRAAKATWDAFPLARRPKSASWNLTQRRKAAKVQSSAPSLPAVWFSFVPLR